MLNGLKGSTGSVPLMRGLMDSVDTPTVLSLYSGGGGLDLGFRMAVPDARTVCYVERDAASIEVLVTNMQKGRLDEAPIWTDSGTFDGKPWRGTVDWIIGGFPCQPWSVAGAQRGTDDERWLWPHIRRIAREVEPGGLFLENVPGLLLGGIQPVLGELAEDGYDAIWTTVRASDVGAPHRRERCFIMAYRKSERLREAREHITGQTPRASSDRTALADSNDRQRFQCKQQAGSRHAVRSNGTVANPKSQPRVTVCGRFCDTNASRTGVHITGDSGRRGVGDADQQGSQGRSEPERERGNELPAWPPGPSDTDAWARVIERWPGLVPAVGKSTEQRLSQRDGQRVPTAGTRDAESKRPSGRVGKETPQSTLRGVAHGDGDGLARSDQLRILGNGVVPLQAAVAFRTLVTQARRL